LLARRFHLVDCAPAGLAAMGGGAIELPASQMNPAEGPDPRAG
jgi:hypothetical protein